jgi:hypothetical protein
MARTSLEALRAALLTSAAMLPEYLPPQLTVTVSSQPVPGVSVASTVWATGGCQGWYPNAVGRNPVLWPASTLAFRRATRRLDLGEYRVIPAETVSSSEYRALSPGLVR